MPYLTLILLLLSTNVFAKNIGAIFSYSTEYEGSHIDQLELKNKKLFVNNKEMVKYQLDLNSTELKIILGLFKADSNGCSRGIYTLSQFDGKKSIVEKGCIYSKRFKVLKKAFRVLSEKTPLIKLKD
jgi:hypothetical protein